MIFISYSSKDTHIALQIRDMLEANGVQCWIAPRNIRGGDNYAHDIPSAIRRCSGMLLLLTEHAQRSVYVPKELAMAQVCRKTIVPFRLDNAELKDHFLLELINVQLIEAYARLESAYAELIQRLQRIESGKESPRQAEAPDAPDEDALTAFDFFSAGCAEEEKTLPDLKKALSWYRQAGVLGFAPAHTAAGRVSLLLDRPAEAAKHLEKAVAAAQAESYAMLGRLSEQGLGTDRDVRRAVRLYDQGWRMGSPEAACELARLYLEPAEGCGFAADEQRAMKLWEDAAGEGYPEAMYRLGLLQEKTAPGKALENYRRAAFAGHQAAQERALALLPEKEKSTFLAWLHADDAAKEADADAMYALARQAAGQSEPDYPAAIAWYEKAIKKGSVEAANALGRLYLQGAKGPAGETLVEKSYEKALPVLEKARELGSEDVFALSFLGYLYSGADGRMPPQPRKALELLTKTAGSGDSFSLWKLGHMHHTGILGEKNYEEALKWYTRALEAGNPHAAEHLRRLERDMQNQ